MASLRCMCLFKRAMGCAYVHNMYVHAMCMCMCGLHRSRVVGGIRRLPDGKIDYRDDFFGRPAYLTVSGQLQGEYYACALSNIYTFGPTFRAELSHTARHLAEFWMIEPEMAFCDLQVRICVWCLWVSTSL